MLIGIKTWSGHTYKHYRSSCKEMQEYLLTPYIEPPSTLAENNEGKFAHQSMNQCRITINQFLGSRFTFCCRTTKSRTTRWSMTKLGLDSLCTACRYILFIFWWYFFVPIRSFFWIRPGTAGTKVPLNFQMREELWLKNCFS